MTGFGSLRRKKDWGVVSVSRWELTLGQQRQGWGILKSMGRLVGLIACAAMVAFLFGGVAEAGTARGTVFNRTTGKPAANVDLALINMLAGASQVATTKSDAQGNFSFDNQGIGAGPMLIRASFGGVTFNTALPPGRPNVDVDVYEVSKDPKAITVTSHIVIFQPRGENLLVGEEYVVQNNSQPAQAYFRSEGNFDFAIPDDGKLEQVSTTSSTGMAVKQAAIDKGHGRNAIAYTFRPGETSIRLSYELAYTGNTAVVKLPASYPEVKLLVVAPPGISLTADGLTASGQEQGMMVYTHAPLAAKGVLAVNVSGVAAASSEAEAGGGGEPNAASAGQGGMPQQGNSRTGGPDIQAVPGRLDVLKWPILAGFALLFALGAVVLTRKPVVVAVAAASGEGRVASRVAETAAGKNTAGMAEVSAAVNSSLDALKDSLFRLELRRQAGTISEEEYARERGVMEKTLRDLVRG